MFIRIQTNRAKLKEVITIFGGNTQPTEILIAPRPLPRERFKYYVAYVSVVEGSKNNKLLESIKNNKEMSKPEYDHEINAIKYSWVAGDKNV